MSREEAGGVEALDRFHLTLTVHVSSSISKPCENHGEAWNRASDMAQAYRIGKAESEAALNLLRFVDVATGDSLAAHVKSLELEIQNFLKT